MTILKYLRSFQNVSPRTLILPIDLHLGPDHTLRRIVVTFATEVLIGQSSWWRPLVIGRHRQHRVVVEAEDL